MSEATIHDSTPSGNVILAYGESRPGWFFRWRKFWIVAGVIIWVFVCVWLIWFFGLRLPVPYEPVAMALVRPAVSLPASVPTEWKEAQKHARPFPIVVGFVEDSIDHSIHPFSIVPRWVSGTAISHTLFWKLVTPRGLDIENRSLANLEPSWKMFFSSWLSIWPGRLVSSKTNQEERITGVLANHEWKTDIAVNGEPTTFQPREEDRNWLNIDAFPDSWSFMQQILVGQGHDLTRIERPNSVGWSEDQGNILSINLAYQSDISTTTASIFAAAFGDGQLRPYTLGDGTVIREWRTSELDLNQLPLAIKVADGRVLLDRRRMSFERSALPVAVDTSKPISCDGAAILRLDATSISKIVSFFNIQDVHPATLDMRLGKDGIHTCF